MDIHQNYLNSQDQINITNPLSPYSADQIALPLQEPELNGQKQDVLISKFENNLKRTMQLLGTPSPTGEFAHKKPILENKQLYQSSPTLNIPAKEPYFPREKSQVSDRQLSGNEFRLSILERENHALKSEIRCLEKENSEIVRKTTIQDHLQGSHYGAGNGGGAFKSNGDAMNMIDEISNLKRKIKDSNAENEKLRNENIEIKASFYKKYEKLQKNNDEILMQYEDRYKNSLQSASEKYDREIEDLKNYIDRIENQVKTKEENQKRVVEDLNQNINDLEKQKEELLQTIHKLQLQRHSETSLRATTTEGIDTTSSRISTDANQTLLDQTLREKRSIEERYYDLMNSYNVLLQHNKHLSEKLEKSKANPPASNYHSNPLKNEKISNINVNKDNYSSVKSASSIKKPKTPKSARYLDKRSPNQQSSGKGKIRKNEPSVPSVKTNYNSVNRFSTRARANTEERDENFIRSNLRESELYGPPTVESDLKPVLTNPLAKDVDEFKAEMANKIKESIHYNYYQDAEELESDHDENEDTTNKPIRQKYANNNATTKGSRAQSAKGQRLTEKSSRPASSMSGLKKIPKMPTTTKKKTKTDIGYKSGLEYHKSAGKRNQSKENFRSQETLKKPLKPSSSLKKTGEKFASQSKATLHSKINKRL